MKTYKILTMGVLSATIALTGCKDSFLEVDSYTQFPVDEYFADSAHVAEALVAAYAPLEWTDWANGQYNPVNIMSDIMSDDLWPGGKDRNDNQYWHLMNNFEARQNNCMTGLWTDEYTGVKRCNDLLKYVEGIELPDSTRGAWTAEGKILRAYYYNNLWKFYGNIPFFFTNLEAPYFAPQLSADEVYAKVIEDLEAALDECAVKEYLPIKCKSDEKIGHVTLATGYMLYAEMVMYQQDNSRYGKALNYMKEIIGSGLYGLKKDFASLWECQNEWGDESIFEVDYSDNLTYRGWSAYEARLAGGTVMPRLITNPDGVGALGIDAGWGFAPVRREVYEMYDAKDKRRDVSALDLSGYDYAPRYEDTGLWLGKYIAYSKNVARAAGDKQLNYDNNLRVYRYAETLLNAAELLLLTGQDNDGTGLAKDYLNKVRMRAGLTNLSRATIDNILDERHKEFVGEGKRYWDLIRSGKAATVLVPDAEGYRTNSWTESKKYLPIPDAEISADPNLKQNPGY